MNSANLFGVDSFFYKIANEAMTSDEASASFAAKQLLIIMMRGF